MVEIKQLSSTGVQTVISLTGALAIGARKAAVYNNTTLLDIWCDVWLFVKYDTSFPAAGTQVGVIYVLPGDGAGTEVFPIGGDGAIGTDINPETEAAKGTFTSKLGSITLEENLHKSGVRIPVGNSRWVFENTSGKIINTSMTVKILPTKFQSV